MTRFTQILGFALLAAGLSAEPQKMPAQEKERQPGTLRISGLTEKDQVLLDGELLGDGKRIAQFGSKLLVSPGDYTVTIISSNQGQSCESRIRVPENGVAVARCGAAEPEYDRMVD